MDNKRKRKPALEVPVTGPRPGSKAERLRSRLWIVAPLALAVVGLVLGSRSAREMRAGRTSGGVSISRPTRMQMTLARSAAAKFVLADPSASRNASRSGILPLVDEICDALEVPNATWQDVVFSGLLRALVEADPRVAACLAENWEPGQVREGLLREVGREWAETDPNGAITWAQALANVGERNDVLGDVCAQIAQSDPAQAVFLADRLDIGHGNGVLESAAQLWAGRDFAAALNWVLQQPQGIGRDRLLGRIAFAEAQTSPESAAYLAVESISPGPAQEEAVIAVVHQWGLRDNSAALGWVSAIPGEALRVRALAELTGLASR